MEECNSQVSNSNEEVKYGDTSISHVCGKLEGNSSGESRKEELKEIYTRLFKSMGEKKTANGSVQNSGVGSSSCLTGTEKGAITTLGDKEYLGVCERKAEHKEEGVEIEGKNTDKLIIRVCSGNSCFGAESSQTGGIKTFNSKGSGGKEVKFQKK